MAFADYARGIYIDDTHVNTDPSLMKGNIHFVVVYAGSGGDVAKRPIRFTQNLAVAAKANVPVLARYDIIPDYYRGLVNWPAPQDDAHIKVMVRQFMSGLAMRGVHGVLLDISRYWHDDGSEATPQWMKDIAIHVSSCVWALFKLPVYFFVSRATIDHFPGENAFTVWLDNLKYFSSFETAYPDAPVQEHIADWKNFPIPDDTDKLRLQRGIGWDFWNYCKNKFTFAGITDANSNKIAVPCWLYAGTSAKLYSELNFTPIATPTEPTTPDPSTPDPEPGNDETPTDGTSVFWVAIYAGLDAFAARWVQGRSK